LQSLLSEPGKVNLTNRVIIHPSMQIYNGILKLAGKALILAAKNAAILLPHVG
jgi:hypothetical protein